MEYRGKVVNPRAPGGMTAGVLTKLLQPYRRAGVLKISNERGDEFYLPGGVVGCILPTGKEGLEKRVVAARFSVRHV
ncbi:hypothetical protein SAMN00808754_1674 [Thermanaeromonas toyohensis ToBE]|uniref:Uncharacterized protein n=1 Tax=Thermanaeromonas toyohensis ToBE TaxID=698762 RepID=A0A1W1VTZ1_9FIRM|nr:hypothetical protein SAMN00808754_1674 [Thermanaeromonas toyohensis ToBE]